MNGFIIRDGDSAPPVFFAPAAPVAHMPAAMRWSQDPAHALAFARKVDAQTFLDVFLPQVAPLAAIVPYTEPTTP